MPHLNVAQSSAAIGMACTVAVILITVGRQKRFHLSDLGTFIGAFLAGINIPPALFLCFYIFMNDPKLDETALKGYEKYISGAGLLLFLANVIGVWTACQLAWNKPTGTRISHRKR